MNLDMGAFIGQIIPIIIAYLMIPAVVLGAYFVIRRMWRKRNGTPVKKNQPEATSPGIYT